MAILDERFGMIFNPLGKYNVFTLFSWDTRLIEHNEIFIFYENKRIQLKNYSFRGVRIDEGTNNFEVCAENQKGDVSYFIYEHNHHTFKEIKESDSELYKSYHRLM